MSPPGEEHVSYELVCYVDGSARVWFDLPDGYNGPRHAEKYIADIAADKRERKRYGIPVFNSGHVSFGLKRIATIEDGAGYTWDDAQQRMVYGSRSLPPK